MLTLPGEGEVLGRLVRWAEGEPAVRALVLTSNRARGDGTADALSDYDVVVGARAGFAIAACEHGYPEPVVRWGDEDEVLGLPTRFRGVIHADGIRVDYTLWPEELLARVAEAPVLPDALDVGYRVLVDKDGATKDWPPPTHTVHLLAPPTEAEYRALADEFWWDLYAAAKGLARRHLVFARFALDYDAKFVALRRFLEWRAAAERGWRLAPRGYGKGLEELLADDVRAELAATHAGGGVEESWAALFGTAALFRRVARDVADALGYRYPQEADDAMVELLRGVRELRLV